MVVERIEPDVDALGIVWSKQTEIVRNFVEQLPKYESLCEEVAYILRKRLKQEKIQFAAVTSRAKSINSFCEKIARKNYESPLSDITDLAGVRIVYLYRTDRPAIEKLIEKEFRVKEKVDKTDQQDSDRFGYGALHYLVNLGKGSSGARYDDLKELFCEIQVRTVLQDAWAIIAHHLSYKQKAAVPKTLRRKLNSLSGLFETADDQFDRLREEREVYIRNIIDKEEQFLRREIDLDVLSEYLKNRFPDRMFFTTESANNLLSDLYNTGYTTMAKLDGALTRSSKALNAFEETIRLQLNPVICTRVSLSILDYAFFKEWEKRDPAVSGINIKRFLEMIDK